MLKEIEEPFEKLVFFFFFPSMFQVIFCQP